MVARAAAAFGAALLGLLLAARVGDGSYASLVQGWYRPVLLITSALLLGMAIAVALQVMRGGQAVHGSLSIRQAATAVVTAVPLVLGFAYAPEPLGSESFVTFEETGTGASEFGATARSSSAAQRNLYQWAYEFATADPATILGDTVDVVGFVYHDQAGTEGQFAVARFVVACCVADARGYTLPVRWRDAASLEPDSWVRVQGRVATGPDGALVILAEAVETVAAPANPYIYP